MISINYGSSTSSWKPRRLVRLDLILMTSLQWGIYTSIPIWTHSQNSLAAAEALSLNISSHGTSLKLSKTVPISTWIVISYTLKRGILLWVWQKVRGNWYNNMIRISQCRKSHCRTNTSIRRNKWIQKSRTESHSQGCKLET